jgi:hypothetical protein
MAPRLSVDEKLRALREIRDRGELEQIRIAALKNLGDSCNLVVAEAAKLICDFELAGSESDLLRTWERLIGNSDPIKADKGCVAKAAIAQALGGLEYDDPDFYLAGMNYQQIEPAWPKAEDTAEHVRANCAFALVPSKQLRLVDKLNAFVDYMQGSHSDQMNAAAAIADTGHEMAVPLLRLRLQSGDHDAEVLGVCMAGLLKLAPTSSLSLVTSFLKHRNENVVLETAVALGTSGLPKAVESLIDCCKRAPSGDLQRSLLISIGLTRNPAAIDFLLAQLESGRNTETVLDALKPSCVYEETQNRVRDVLDQINDKKSIAEFERKYGHGKGKQ